MALASALKCDPDLIFEYVYDNIEFEPLYGSNKGPLGTLLDLRGDDADQAMLLVALWNTAGFSQTGYVNIGLSLTGSQIANWLGVPNDAQAIVYLLDDGGIPYKNEQVNSDGSLASIEIGHFISALQLDGTWYYFDPSLKSHNVQNGSSSLSTILGYDQEQFLNDAGGTIGSVSISNVNRAALRSDLVTYANNLINYVNQNGRTSSVTDLIGGKSIVPLTGSPTRWEMSGVTPSPTFPADCPNQTTTPECRTYITITIPGASSSQVIKLYTDQVYGHRITVFSVPSGSDYVPTLLIDGAPPACVAQGTCTNVGPATGAGQTWSVPIQVVEPNQPTGSSCPSGITACKTLTIAAGGSYLIGLGTGQVGRSMAEYHRQLLAQARAAGNADSSEIVLGENLAVISYNWLAQCSAEQQITDQMAQTTTLYHFGVGIAGQANIQQTGYAGPYVDLPVNNLSVQPWTSQGPTTTIGNYSYPTAMVAAGLTDSAAGSAFESAVLEQTQAPVANMTAASTIKIVDDNMNSAYSGALQQTFLATNESDYTNTIEPAIQSYYSQTDLNSISSGVAAGAQVLIPETGQLSVGLWKGAGYTEVNPISADEFSVTQKISGGMSGGFSGTDIPDPAPNTQITLPPPSDSDTISSLLAVGSAVINDTIAEPVDGIAGAYIYNHIDLVIGSGPFPYSLPFSRTYLSSSGTYLTTTTADVGMGNGWANNYSTTAEVESDPYIGIGSDDSSGVTAPNGVVGPIGSSAVSAATSVAALYVMQDLLSVTPTAQTMTIASMVTRWFTDQLTGNTVMLNWPNTTEEFTALPHADGSTAIAYNPPPDSSTRLTQTAPGAFTYARKDGVTLDFGPTPAGALQGWVYPDGMRVNLTYSGSQLSGISNSIGRSLSLSYNGNDIVKVTDSTGRSVSYSYDANHNLIGFTGPLNYTTTFSYDVSGTYDTLGHLTQVFYPFRSGIPFVTNWYDPLGRVAQQANANGYTSNFYFAGFRSETVDGAGDRQVTYQTDTGRIVMSAAVLNNSLGDVFFDTVQQNGTVDITTNQYDGLDRLTLTTLPAGGTAAYVFATNLNPWANNIASVTRTAVPGSPLQPLETQYTYDSIFNKPTSVTDPLGLVTTMSYDPATGNLLAVIADAGTGHLNATSHFTYDQYGRVLTATDPLGIVTANSYDSAENLVTQVADSGGTGHIDATTRYAYNALGDQISQTDPNGNIWTMSYDANRQLLTTTAPAPFNLGTSLVQTTNAYDPDGHVLSVTRTNGSENQVTRTSYTNTGKAAATTDPNGNATTYGYDADDRLVTVTDPLLRTTTFGYDALSRLISTVDPTGHLAEQRTYSPHGMLASLTDANGNTINYTYDGFDRLSTTTWPDSSTETLTYDADANMLTRKTRAGPTITYTYDTLNRRVSKAAPSEPTVTYAYDLAGHLTGVSDTSPAIASVAGTAQYATTLTYDQLNRPTNVSWSPAPTQTTSVASSVAFAYSYAADNRRIGQTTTDNTWWLYPSAASSVSYAVNDLNQYTAVGSASPSYDGNGNLTYDGTFTYGYDAENRLTSITQSGTTVASYGYDGQGRRKCKVLGATDGICQGTGAATTIYVADADNRAVLAYNGASGAVETWYAYGLGPAAVLNEMNVVAGTRETLIPDVQGSIVATLVSNTGALTKTPYLAFGENPSLTVGGFNYTAQLFDPETAGSASQPSGLYYYRARMYSPTWGRFLQPDPLGYAAGDNPYAYTDNDPLNNVDPDGTQAVPGFLIGVAAGGSAGYIAGGWKGAVIGGVVGGVVGVGAAPLSAAAAGAVLTATGSSTLSATTAGVVFTAVNAGAGAGATIVTNKALGNPTYQDVGTGALVGGLAPVLSGETALVGLGGAAEAGLPTLTNYVLSAQTGIGGVLGTAATSLTPSANSNVPTTGLYIGPGALNFGSQAMK